MEKTGSALTKPPKQPRVDAPQKFSKRKLQDASIGKSIPAKTQKSKLRIWPKFRCREAATGKLPKNQQKKTRSISPFTIVIKGVREFFRENSTTNPQPPKQSSSPKTLREERLRQ